MTHQSLRGKALPRSWVESYRVISYEPSYPQTWFTTDSWAEMARLSAGASDWLARLVDRIRAQGDEALALQEADTVKRLLCNWRAKGKFPFPYVNGDELINRNAAQADWLRPELRALGLRLRSIVIAGAGDWVPIVVSTALFPVNKSKSSPFWIPGTQRAGAYVLAAMTNSVSNVADLNDTLARCGAQRPPCISLLERSQAAKKPRQIYESDQSGRPVAIGASALMPKVRKVQAVPFVYNYAYGVLGAVMIEALRRLTLENDQVLGLPTSQTAVAVYAAAQARGEVGLAEDLSAYDDSVSLETLLATSELVTLPIVDALLEMGAITASRAALIIDLEGVIPTLTTMIPPLASDEIARLIPHEGTISSGKRLTSVEGTVINIARLRTMAKLIGAKLTSIIFSDDTVVFGTTDAIKAYTTGGSEASVKHGFTTTTADDVSFLMKRLNGGYSYIGRMMMSTLQKEARSEPRDLATAALGVTARVIQLHGHPLAAEYPLALKAGLAGERYQAAWNLAEATGLDVGTLGMMILTSRPEGAHTEEELTRIAESIAEAPGASAEQKAAATRLARVVEVSAKPLITSIDEAATAAYSNQNGSLNLAAARATIRAVGYTGA